MFQGQGGGGRGSHDPFARMNRMMDQMFNGRGSFFGPAPFALSPFFTDPFFALPPPTNQAAAHRQSRPRQLNEVSDSDSAASDTVVEELPSGSESAAQNASGHQPLIEEPEEVDAGRMRRLSSRAGPSSHRYAPGHHDIIGEDNALSRRDRSHVSNHVPDDFFNGIMSNFGGGFGGGHGFGMPGFGSGFGNFSDSNGGSGGGHFYGSSTTYAAGDGGGFCKSTTVRRGPNGAEEVEQRVQEGGTETVTCTRRLGRKVRTTTTRRDSNGETTTQESVEGMSQADAEDFDNQWAAKSGRLTIESQQQSSGGGSAMSSSWGGNRPGGRSNRRRLDIL